MGLGVSEPGCRSRAGCDFCSRACAGRCGQPGSTWAGFWVAESGGAPCNWGRLRLRQTPVGYSYRGGLPGKVGMVIEGELAGSTEDLRGASDGRERTFAGPIRTGSCVQVEEDNSLLPAKFRHASGSSSSRLSSQTGIISHHGEHKDISRGGDMFGVFFVQGIRRVDRMNSAGNRRDPGGESGGGLGNLVERERGGGGGEGSNGCHARPRREFLRGSLAYPSREAQ